MAIYELKENEVDKKGAMELLDVSERTLASYPIPKRYEKGKTSKIAVYMKADVLAYKEEIDNPARSSSTAKPVRAVEVANSATAKDANPAESSRSGNQPNTATLAKVATPAMSRGGESAEFAAQIGAHFAAGMAQAIEVQNLAVLPLLTFAQAATLTGISEKRLRDAAKEGQLPTSKNLGRAQKMRRADLDKWITDQFK